MRTSAGSAFYFILLFIFEGCISLLIMFTLSVHIFLGKTLISHSLNPFCRKRTLVAIGTHDLDTIEGPFTYEVTCSLLLVADLVLLLSFYFHPLCFSETS